MDSGVRDEVEMICSFEGRTAGTDAERRLANRLASELEATGRDVTVEPITLQPRWPLVHFLHCAIAVAGSVVAASEPAVGFGLVLLAATSAYLDLSARRYLLRRLFFRRASQNVHARTVAELGTPRVVLCANLDAPRTGAVYNRTPMRLSNAVARHLPVTSSPPRIWFWSIALLLPPIGLRMAGLDDGLLAVVQLPPTLILIVTMFALGEIALSPASPGANANASGIACALALARRLDADPPSELAVDLAICGGGETTMEGMRAFLRSHREDLRDEDVRFVSLESVGRGDPRFVVSQGLAVSTPMDLDLVRLCEAIALASESPEEAPEPIRDGFISAASVAGAHGQPAIAITCREPGLALPPDHHTPADVSEAIDPESIARAADLAEQLIRLLARDLARKRPEREVATA